MPHARADALDELGHLTVIDGDHPRAIGPVARPPDPPRLGLGRAHPHRAAGRRPRRRRATNPEIGARLFMSRSTVKTHLAHVYAKLGVANRTGLASVAARRRPGRQPS